MDYKFAPESGLLFQAFFSFVEGAITQYLLLSLNTEFFETLFSIGE